MYSHLLGAFALTLAAASFGIPGLPEPPEPLATTLPQDQSLVIKRDEWLTIETPADNSAIDKAVMASASQVPGGGVPYLEPGNLYVKDGEFQGLWLRGNGRKGALRLQFSERPPYHVNATLHCPPRDRVECNGMRAVLDALEAPSPGPGHPAYSGWIRVVGHEACDGSAPVNMPQPTYPVPAQRSGISGDVDIVMVYNRCGKVRGVELLQSSGWLDLDQAAMDQTRKWVLPHQPVGGRARQKISFKLE